MSVHIGLMIWKEMKRQDLSSAFLATELKISKVKAQDILNSASIDTELLMNISEILNYNFFHYYEDSKAFSKIETQSKQKSAQEIERLRHLIAEKNKMIDLKDQFIKTQTNLIGLLEKGKYI